MLEIVATFVAGLVCGFAAAFVGAEALLSSIPSRGGIDTTQATRPARCRCAICRTEADVPGWDPERAAAWLCSLCMGGGKR